jgi:phosphate transport system permease protein
MSISENSRSQVGSSPALPIGPALKKNIQRRQQRGRLWRNIYIGTVIVAIIALFSLVYSILNSSYSLVAILNEVDPDTLSDQPLDELSKEELGQILLDSDTADLRKNSLRFTILELLYGYTNDQAKTFFRDIARQPVQEGFKNVEYPQELRDVEINALEKNDYIAILILNLDEVQLLQLIDDKILKPRIVGTWKIVPSLFEDRDKLRTQVEAREELRAEKIGEPIDVNPDAIEFEYRWWVNRAFLKGTYNTQPEFSGIRTAAIGSIYMIIVTIGFALPIGIGAAVYLEEYANHHFINRVIQVNISNLAGVPSIVYGMLGLVIFVRALDNITSGSTVISAGLTMGLLILPVIIVASQEAIRAVPNSLRQASYGIGATKWQTIWHHVLPNAIPGIMTGTILAISRAIGETAPLIVIGASTRITRDPNFTSKFTVLPIQIFNWTSLPDPAFRNVAAAAILVLLILLLSLNSIAIIIRNRFSRRML